MCRAGAPLTLLLATTCRAPRDRKTRTRSPKSNVMRELALFSGGGGGLLASRLLGWRTVCAVEINQRCREVLLARQKDGVLEDFPIYEDVRSFDGKSWRGHVEVVSGGFPCQPFSSAARGRNVAVDLWPDMLRIIDEVRPGYVFAENVGRDPIARAAADLHRLGFACRFGRLSAADVVAPHRRERYWLRGDAYGKSEPVGAQHDEVARLLAASSNVWSSESRRHIRMADGLAGDMGRARAAGNGQVPLVAAIAWHGLHPRKHEGEKE